MPEKKILNLTDDERAALTKLVRDSIAADNYPLSPRIRRLKALLAKLDPAPVATAEPLPPPRHASTAASGSGEAAVGVNKAPCIASSF